MVYTLLIVREVFKLIIVLALAYGSGRSARIIKESNEAVRSKRIILMGAVRGGEEITKYYIEIKNLQFTIVSNLIIGMGCIIAMVIIFVG